MNAQTAIRPSLASLVEAWAFADNALDYAYRAGTEDAIDRADSARYEAEQAVLANLRSQGLSDHHLRRLGEIV